MMSRTVSPRLLRTNARPLSAARSAFLTISGLAVVAHERGAFERRAQRLLDDFRPALEFAFVCAEARDRMDDDLGGVAEQPVALIFHDDVGRRRHEASLGDIFLQSGGARAGRAEREQLILAFFQAQMLKMFFGENGLSIAERADGERFSLEIGGALEFRPHDE